jgi:hypothetical protein
MKVASAFESDCEGTMIAGTTKRFCPFRQQPTKMPYIKSVLKCFMYMCMLEFNFLFPHFCKNALPHYCTSSIEIIKILHKMIFTQLMS